MSLTTPFAVFLAGLLIAAALALGLVVDRYAPGGMFMLEGGTPAAFRLNVRNGAVDACLLEAEPPGAPNYQDYLPNRYAVRCPDTPLKPAKK